MSPSILVPALLIYPLVYVVPLNLVRFQWGFKQGLAPMPPEVEEKAEAADRLTILAARFILLTAIVLLMRASPISPSDAGITADNWKFAFAMGALLGLIPLSLNAMLSSNVPSKASPKNLEARGSAASWCGLIVLGSFSDEFWRAFCIVALIRLGSSPWLAVVIAAVFFAAPSLQTSIARALGSASLAGVTGFLFVYTGSLLAPLTTSLIGGVAHIAQRLQIFFFFQVRS
jgi:hypothetical protein